MNGSRETGERVKIRLTTWNGDQTVLGVVKVGVPEWAKGTPSEQVAEYRDMDGHPWTVRLCPQRISGWDGSKEVGQYESRNVRMGDEVKHDGIWKTVRSIGKTLFRQRIKVRLSDGTVLRNRPGVRLSVQW